MSWANPYRDYWNIPEDAEVIRTTGMWDIYHSQLRKAIYIYPADYHLASLKLELEELRELLQLLEAGPGAGAPRDGSGDFQHPAG